MGELVKNPDLGVHAPDDRRAGAPTLLPGRPSPRVIAAYMKANGGLITEADLAGFQAFEDLPIRVNYRGIDVYECPPNSQGFVMLQALNILEGLTSSPWATTARRTCTRHRIAEAGVRRSQQIRRRPEVRAAHPDARAAVEGYAAARRALIDPTHAIDGEAPAGEPAQPTASGAPDGRLRAPRGTAGLVGGPRRRRGRPDDLPGVIDRDRNMVSLRSPPRS